MVSVGTRDPIWEPKEYSKMAEVTFTVTVKGEDAEVRATLLRIFGAEATGDPALAGRSESKKATGTGWTFEEFRFFWQAVASDAQTILAEMAKRPEGYPMAELYKAVGLTGRQAGGRLSSVGHALHNYPDKSLPVIRDWAAEQYRMGTDVADFVRRLTTNGEHHS